MTWTEIKLKWWHRAACVVLWLCVVVGGACLLIAFFNGLREPAEVGLSLLIFTPILYIAYRLLLYIIYGKIAGAPITGA